jgi:hypothetical protein
VYDTQINCPYIVGHYYGHNYILIMREGYTVKCPNVDIELKVRQQYTIFLKNHISFNVEVSGIIRKGFYIVIFFSLKKKIFL